MTEEILAYVGVDWAYAMHHAFVLDAQGERLDDRAFPHSGEGLQDLIAWIRRITGAEPRRVAIGIEVPHGPVVETLMDGGFLVHALNPKQLDRFRDRFTIAGAKDDRRDAFVLADVLRTDRRFYRLLEPMHPTIVALREWSRMADELSIERNRLANRVRHQLWRYYPQFLDIAEDWTSDWILDLWRAVPTPAKARNVRVTTIQKLLARTRSRRWDAPALIELLRRTPVAVAPGVTEACVDHILLLVRRLRLVTDQLRSIHRRLDQLSDEVAALPAPSDEGNARPNDVQILRSLPGVGRIVLAALLSEAFDALARRDVQALRGLSGVAPVTRRSGRQHQVVMRNACPVRLRTAAYHWARVAVMMDQHSRSRYAALRKRGHSHARSLRSVASRLIGVACAMLTSGTLFDPSLVPQGSAA